MNRTISLLLLMTAALMMYSARSALSPGFILLASLALSVASSVVSVWTCDSLLLFLRQGLLFIAGILPAALFINAEGTARIAYQAERYQGIPVATQVLLLGTIGICANALGWVLAQNWIPANGLRRKADLATARNLWFYIFIGLAALSGTIVARSLGPFVWDTAYAANTSPLPLNIGSFPLIAVLTLCMSFVILRSSGTLAAKIEDSFTWAITAIYLIFFCFIFRGMRVESVSALFALISLDLLINRRPLRPLRILAVAFCAYILVLGWGAYRALAADKVSLYESILMAVSQFGRNESGGETRYMLGTIGDIAATFFTVVGVHDYRDIPLLHGKGYFDYILRTLPEFLTPNRPRDLAWYFSEIGETSGGGIFELSEAYLNFGAPGCVLVPLILGGLLSTVELWVRRSRTTLSYLVYSAIGLSVFRGTLYQTFSFYRAMIIAILFAATIALLEWLYKSEVGRRVFRGLRRIWK